MRTKRTKLAEWLRRYLPCEIAGTIGELGGAAVAYLLTGSFAAAAIAGTVGASAGYYAAAYVAALRWSYQTQRQRAWTARVLIANALAMRSVAIEFGPAELIDSVIVRPVAYYVGPFLFGSAIVGWIAGKVFSDIAFYVCAIFSYERFTNLLARRRPERTGEADGAVAAAAAA